jgi:hypothetical protein
MAMTLGHKEQGKYRTRAEEIKFSRITSKYTLFHHKMYQNILKELSTQPDLLQISNYNRKSVQHVSRIKTSRRVYSYEISTGRKKELRAAVRESSGLLC